MFRRVLTPKQENSKTKISKPKDKNDKNDKNAKNTISLEYIFLNFH